MQKNLRLAAQSRGHLFWARGPDNAGHYNSRPDETGFFCDKGDYDSYYGRFFLHWYAQTLIDHADQILSLTNLALEGTEIIAKVFGSRIFNNLILLLLHCYLIIILITPLVELVLVAY